MLVERLQGIAGSIISRHQTREGGQPMNRAGLLQETTAWMDTADLALCLFIYEVCNDYQFEYLSGSDFCELPEPETHRTGGHRAPGKGNFAICHMVFSIARTIRPRERGKLWSEEEFPKRRGISKLLLTTKHRSDVCNNAATKENQDFQKSIDKLRRGKRKTAERHQATARRFPHSARWYLPI